MYILSIAIMNEKVEDYFREGGQILKVNRFFLDLWKYRISSVKDKDLKLTIQIPRENKPGPPSLIQRPRSLPKNKDKLRDQDHSLHCFAP